nr:MAG TPA: hypothetical protein [Caudoviricetes sp.]
MTQRHFRYKIACVSIKLLCSYYQIKLKGENQND